MKPLRKFLRLKAVAIAFLLLFTAPTFASDSIDLESAEWNAILGGMDYISKHPFLRPSPNVIESDGTATGVKSGLERDNHFIAHFKAKLVRSVSILYAHGYYTRFQARHLIYTIRNADVTGDEAMIILNIIGSLGEN